jgi:hypothetical protein
VKAKLISNVPFASTSGPETSLVQYYVISTYLQLIIQECVRRIRKRIKKSVTKSVRKKELEKEKHKYKKERTE